MRGSETGPLSLPGRSIPHSQDQTPNHETPPAGFHPQPAAYRTRSAARSDPALPFNCLPELLYHR